MFMVSLRTKFHMPSSSFKCIFSTAAMLAICFRYKKNTVTNSVLFESCGILQFKGCFHLIILHYLYVCTIDVRELLLLFVSMG